MSKKEKADPPPASVIPQKNEVLELIERVAKAKGHIPRPETYGVWQNLDPEIRKQFRSPAYMKTFIEENEIDSFEALKTVYNTAYNEYDKLGREEKKDKETLFHLTNLVEAYETFRPYEQAKKLSKQLKGLDKRLFDFQNRKLLGENYDLAETEMRRWMFRTETKIKGKVWIKEKEKLEEKMEEQEKQLKAAKIKTAAAQILVYNKDEEDRVNMIEQQKRVREQQRETEQTIPQVPRKKSRGMEL